LEWWNAGMLGFIGNYSFTDFNDFLSRSILPIAQFYIFPEPIIPSFHYSNCEQSELTCPFNNRFPVPASFEAGM
jgi:hypothetical protein